MVLDRLGKFVGNCLLTNLNRVNGQAATSGIGVATTTKVLFRELGNVELAVATEGDANGTDNQSRVHVGVLVKKLVSNFGLIVTGVDNAKLVPI